MNNRFSNQRKYAVLIAQLLRSEKLTRWERFFLEGLRGLRPTPSQITIIEKIKVRVGVSEL